MVILYTEKNDIVFGEGPHALEFLHTFEKRRLELLVIALHNRVDSQTFFDCVRQASEQDERSEH